MTTDDDAIACSIRVAQRLHEPWLVDRDLLSEAVADLRQGHADEMSTQGIWTVTRTVEGELLVYVLASTVPQQDVATHTSRAMAAVRDLSAAESVVSLVSAAVLIAATSGDHVARAALVDAPELLRAAEEADL